MLPVNLLGDAAAAEAMVVQASKPNTSDPRSESDRVLRDLERLREASRLQVQPATKTYTHNPVRAHEDRLPYRPRHERKRAQRHPDREADDAPRQAFQPLLFEMQTDRQAERYEPNRFSERLGERFDLTI